MSKSQPKWFRKADLARHYNVDPSTIIRWVTHKADFPAGTHITDGVVAWHVDQIEAYDRKLIESSAAA